MVELSDASVALPGGIGTFEEIFEVWAWAQFGSRAKPCAVLDVHGFSDQLLGVLDHVVDEAFADYRVPTKIKWRARRER